MLLAQVVVWDQQVGNLVCKDNSAVTISPEADPIFVTLSYLHPLEFSCLILQALFLWSSSILEEFRFSSYTKQLQQLFILSLPFSAGLSFHIHHIQYGDFATVFSYIIYLTKALQFCIARPAFAPGSIPGNVPRPKLVPPTSIAFKYFKSSRLSG